METRAGSDNTDEPTPALFYEHGFWGRIGKTRTEWALRTSLDIHPFSRLNETIPGSARLTHGLDGTLGLRETALGRRLQ